MSGAFYGRPISPAPCPPIPGRLITDERDPTLEARINALGLRDPAWTIGATQTCKLLDPAAWLEVNGQLTVSPATFRALREYSTSLPTGTTEGKVWKARLGIGWCLARYGAPYPAGHEHEGQVPISWWPLWVAGDQPRWPADVRVPRQPMRGRMTDYRPPEPVRPDLPDGVWERDGQLWAECRACEQEFELPCEPEEFDPATAYCGGSPRCLP